MTQPLILTLRLDGASEKLLTSLRTRYFPSSRNFLSAHITLFHALPPSNRPLYTSLLTTVTHRENRFTLGLKDPFPLGKKGVALNVSSFKLRKIHEELLAELRGKDVQLTEQDQRRLRPHVTVQNKVGEEEARRTLEEVRRKWGELEGVGEALSLWRSDVEEFSGV
ncbi:hypothetical protein EYC80_005308 [Monilinia laxa]|uniref:Uncharacterized protein n=1 Tax=Monilinia laxa TaxID=61186 RepID=A0A5N6KJH4_MONLA|nr:hypothetical protein EYC80_005308 [Monilinia laxa]